MTSSKGVQPWYDDANETGGNKVKTGTEVRPRSSSTSSRYKCCRPPSYHPATSTKHHSIEPELDVSEPPLPSKIPHWCSSSIHCIHQIPSLWRRPKQPCCAPTSHRIRFSRANGRCEAVASNMVAPPRASVQRQKALVFPNNPDEALDRTPLGLQRKFDEAYHCVDDRGQTQQEAPVEHSRSCDCWMCHSLALHGDMDPQYGDGIVVEGAPLSLSSSNLAVDNGALEFLSSCYGLERHVPQQHEASFETAPLLDTADDFHGTMMDLFMTLPTQDPQVAPSPLSMDSFMPSIGHDPRVFQDVGMHALNFHQQCLDQQHFERPVTTAFAPPMIEYPTSRSAHQSAMKPDTSHLQPWRQPPGLRSLHALVYDSDARQFSKPPSPEYHKFQLAAMPSQPSLRVHSEPSLINHPLSPTSVTPLHGDLAVAERPRVRSVPTPPQEAQTELQASIEIATVLSDCYWKNGRKNLQCFPNCPEHNDFYSMKMNNRKHSSVGVCRGPVYTHVTATAPTTSQHGDSQPLQMPRTQQMKYENGVGASGSGGSDYELFVLGRFERVPQRDENVQLHEKLTPPQHFSTSHAFEDFRYGCFQAVEMEDRRTLDATAGQVHSTWFFLPDVWKVQPMLKKKRKATRSAPAQTFPFCFRVFVYLRDPAASTSTSASAPVAYKCIASAASSFFELYSTRTVDRVKRKYWPGGSRDDCALADTVMDDDTAAISTASSSAPALPSPSRARASAKKCRVAS